MRKWVEKNRERLNAYQREYKKIHGIKRLNRYTVGYRCVNCRKKVKSLYARKRRSERPLKCPFCRYETPANEVKRIMIKRW